MFIRIITVTILDLFKDYCLAKIKTMKILILQNIHEQLDEWFHLVNEIVAEWRNYYTIKKRLIPRCPYTQNRLVENSLKRQPFILIRHKCFHHHVLSYE